MSEVKKSYVGRALVALCLSSVVMFSMHAVTNVEAAVDVPVYRNTFLFDGNVDAVEYLSNGNTAIVGSFQDSEDLDMTDSEFLAQSNGQADLYISWYNSSGEFMNAVSFGGVSYDNIEATAVDQDDNLYVAGQFRETVDFDPGEGVDEYTAFNTEDLFLAKYNSQGEFVSVIVVVGESVATSRSLVVDSAGDVYMAGMFRRSVEFPSKSIPVVPSAVFQSNNSSFDTFVVRYTSDFEYIDLHHISGEDRVEVQDMVIDEQNNLYLSGSLQGEADFDSSEEDYIIAGPGFFTRASGMFMSKINTSFAHQFTRAYPGTGYASADQINISPIDGSIILSGSFNDSINLNSNEEEEIFINASEEDIIVNGFGNTDALAVFLDASGEYENHVHIGGTDDEAVNAAVINDDGELFIAGFYDEGFDMDFGPGENTFVSQGQEDVYLTKINADQTYGYSMQYASSGEEFVNWLDINPAGDIVFGGSLCSSTVDFDFGEGEDILSDESYCDAFVTEFSDVTLYSIENVPQDLELINPEGEDVSRASFVAGESAAIRLRNNQMLIAGVDEPITQDIDMSSVETTTSEDGKVLIKGLSDIFGDGNITFFVPKLSDDENVLYYCPGVASLDVVDDDCDGVTSAEIPELSSQTTEAYALANISQSEVSLVTIDGVEYYQVTGLGDGAVFADVLASDAPENQTETEEGAGGPAVLVRTGGIQ